ncbi:MAG TPA: 2-oxoglutarate and iron-dependent oxygenase domain-containing protein, partial [Novosphingobium sp.]|nr:2-oxoglutarate and iron-dependent oxygenase domain-containing protein [Novosphingobium sp.]
HSLAALPVLSLAAPRADFARDIGASFRRFGFALVADHGIDAALIAEGWRLTEAFFALPEAEKRRWHVPGIGGARGYTPFRTEIAKGASAHDLKEFWHVGRDLADSEYAAGTALAASMPRNLWPDAPAHFADTFRALYAAFDAAGARILAAIALDLGLAEDWFAPAIDQGNSVLRLLHYPPIAGASCGAIRAGAHEDINLITLLLGAEEAGLELLTKQGEWQEVAPPPGALVINIGDMLQRLTNHVLPSTTHRVRNPDAARAAHSRYSMPFFLHLRSDFAFHTLPQCITPENPDRYPVSITADDYLQERLREIGLTK